MELQLSWSDKLALIEHYNPSIDEIKTTFNVSQDDLDCAFECQRKGAIKPNKNFDVNAYGNIFKDKTVTISPRAVARPPQKQPRKRGRKGDKIQIAFNNLPTTPVPADKFMEQYGISLPVLRQFKRFDNTGLPGDVYVRKLNVNGNKVLMVWRSKE